MFCTFVGAALMNTLVGDDHAQANKPVEASELPLSDKPVTLSFKGGFGQKPGFTAIPTGPVKRAPPTTLGFSMADDDGTGEGDEGGEQNQAEDPKGWSHILRYEGATSGIFGLTSHPLQWLHRRRLPL